MPSFLPSFRPAAVLVLAALLVVTTGCKKESTGPTPPPVKAAKVDFGKARETFRTKLTRQERDGTPPAVPPANSGLRLVRYPSPAGQLAAYLSTAPNDGKRRPAIVWVFGGFDNGIGESAWEQADPANDQSAAAFRQRGVVTLYPSLRGGNDNPGVREGLYGEVDDVLAAAEFLAAQPGVDPGRIYLGGHSTGGTLALLAAAAAPAGRFRAVFSFGPVDDVTGYGADSLPFDTADEQEARMRAPVRWLHSIKAPTFVFEGSRRGNAQSLAKLEGEAGDDGPVKCFTIAGGDHFSILRPFVQRVADQVARDTGPTTNIKFRKEEMILPR